MTHMENKSFRRWILMEQCPNLYQQPRDVAVGQGDSKIKDWVERVGGINDSMNAEMREM